MDKKKKLPWIELGKDVLILLLAVSAVWLTVLTLSRSGLSGLWQDESSTQVSLVGQREEGGALWPVRMAVTRWDGESAVRFAAQYDRETCRAQFQQAASLLREALSGSSAEQSVSRIRWERALSQTTNLYFDFLGNIPLSVLSGWMSGKENGWEGTARRMILSLEGEEVVLYYQDDLTGNCYARRAEVVTVQQMESAVEGIAENGANFAFERENFAQLDGNTMLLSEQPRPKVYSAANPLAGSAGAERLESDSALGRLVLALDFPDNSYVYSGTDQVVRSGRDTLRISKDGVVSYNAAKGEQSHYQISAHAAQPTVFEIAEACRQIAESAVGAMAGEGRLYLREILPTQTGWTVDFAYCLDGAHVQVGEAGCAAHFTVEGNEIVQFVFQMRSYTDTSVRSIVLPEEQAAAAVQALDKEGSELILVYRDNGGDTLSAGWTAD